MKTTRIAFAVACALGMSVAVAQSAKPVTNAAGAPTQTVAQASTAAPIQTAQAGAAAGGAAGGASTAGAATGFSAMGSLAGTLTFVGAAVVSVAGANQNTTTQH